MAFSFVNYDGPTLPKDPSVRKLIRRQAMRDVAVDRKSRGGYGQHNLRQYPVSIESQDPDEHVSPSRDTPSNDLVHCDNRHNPSFDRDIPDQKVITSTRKGTRRLATYNSDAYTSPFSILPDDWETTRHFALLLNLAPLAGLRLGIVKFSHYKSELSCSGDPVSFSNLGSRRLAHYIMSRYEDAPVLRHATDCVTAKLRLILRPAGCPSPVSKDEVLMYYTKALRALQAALNDETQRMTADTLCATELLGMFELLDENMQAKSWMHHTGGAAQLIQIRGAHRFDTQFEMALFMAHIGPTVMEAILSNKSCFLAEECWKQVMYSAIRTDDSFGQQKDLALPLWNHLVDGPRKFKEVTDAISASTLPPQDVIQDIIACLVDDRTGLLDWMTTARTLADKQNEKLEEDEHGVMFPRLTFDGTKSDSAQVNQLSLWGTYVMCRMLKSRLLYAMAPLHYPSLEAESQHLASKIIKLGQNMAERRGDGFLQTYFISQSTWIAKGILETKDAWSKGKEDGGEGMIEKWKFEAWCKAIGRKSC